MCEFTHCVSAPAPPAPANSSLDATYNGAAYNFTHTEVEVGSSVLYSCAGGMRGDPDWNHTDASAECGDGNVWTPSHPPWPTCIDSKPPLKLFQSGACFSCCLFGLATFGSAPLVVKIKNFALPPSWNFG